jgi:hypothetical protein
MTAIIRAASIIEGIGIEAEAQDDLTNEGTEGGGTHVLSMLLAIMLLRLAYLPCRFCKVLLLYPLPVVQR